MAEANFESLNFEISVNAKDAAQSVRLLRDAVVKLGTELDRIARLDIPKLFLGIGAEAQKAAAQTEISADKISETIRRLAERTKLAKALDMSDAMDRTFNTFERQTAMYDSMMAAANWQQQMADALGGQSFLTIFEAEDQKPVFPTPDLAAAQEAIRTALQDATTKSFLVIEEAADEEGAKAGNIFSEQFAQQIEAAKWATALKASMGQIDLSDAQKASLKGYLDASGYVEQTAERMFAPLKVNGEEIASKYGAMAGRAYWEHFTVQGGDLGGKVQTAMHSSLLNNPASFAQGLGASFNSAIQQTQTFSQVSKTLATVTQTLSPALQAAGVSTEAFGAAMTAAAGPISAVIIAIQVAVKVATFLVDQFKEFVEVCKKFIKTARSLNERFNPFEKMKKELASLLALAKRQVLRRAINAVIKAFTEGLKTGVANLAEFDAEFGASIQSFKNAVGLFKNSVGVAVAPIIQYFIPALNQLLAALTTVMNTIARLTALLTGKHTYTVAKSYEDLGESAGGASGKVKELQRTILGFDEINRLNRDNGSGSGGGSGSGDGISAYEIMDVGDWPYDSWGEALEAFLGWLHTTGVPKLKEGLGNLADAVNTFNTGVYDMLTFGDVQELIGQLGADIGDALNLFLTGGAENGGIDWAALGSAVGIALQSMFNFAANFFANFSFFGLGERIAEAVNNAIQEIKPEDVADTIYGILTSGIKTALGFLFNVNLKDLGFFAGDFINRIIQNIADDIDNVKDWGKIWNNIANGIIAFVDRVNWENLFGTLNTIVDGLFEGLNSVINRLEKDGRFKRIVQQFVEFVVHVAVEWFKLKIHAAFASGIGSMNIGTLLFGDPLNTVGLGSENAFAFQPFGFNQDDFVSSVSRAEGAIASYKDAVSSVGTAASSASSAVRTAVGGPDGIVSQMEKMNTNSSKPISEYAGKIRDLNTSVVSDFSAMRRDSATHLETLRSASNLKFSNMRDNADRYAGQMSSETAQKFQDMSSSADTEMGKVKSFVVSKISEAKSELSQQKFKDVGDNIKNGVIEGMGGFNGKLDKWANQFKERILKNFDIKSPSRWARDAVGTYLSEGIAVGMEASPAVEQACAGLKEGIASEFNDMQFFSGVRASTNRGGYDIASAIGDQVMSGIASMSGNDQQPIVCEVYLDRDRIATAVTRGQQAQNRRYSSTALAY